MYHIKNLFDNNNISSVTFIHVEDDKSVGVKQLMQSDSTRFIWINTLTWSIYLAINTTNEHITVGYNGFDVKNIKIRSIIVISEGEFLVSINIEVNQPSCFNNMFQAIYKYMNVPEFMYVLYFCRRVTL